MNSDARWALERFEAVAAVQPAWNEQNAAQALRRHLVALGFALPAQLKVVGTPSEARCLAARGDSVKPYRAACSSNIRSELGHFDCARAVFVEAIDHVIALPIVDATVAVCGGWDQFRLGADLNHVVLEAAVGVAARAAALSPELVWVWDQLMIAFEHGLGWFTVVDDTLIMVPMPTMVMPEGRLHCTDGPAVRWSDGSKMHFYEGVEFVPALLSRILTRTISAAEALALDNPHQQLLAMSAVPPADLLSELDAVCVDVGVKGTKLYRVEDHFLPDRTDYCITMTDPSTGRCYLEWVDPALGARHDAELCHAHLFGIDLSDWLALRLEA
ncbi:hypothetical protein [Mycolicibacterium vanbaalenii]|uniref:Uncharacterized protein n=1 Tax=Mycolicibacterium vanbaalenii (strain DSM 7251 / JCM 13017 / BCRC 16820 / KCTC 9966 / NRRL B-24157 / PYR-1) TaxID=350058 RepID=A1THQ6_MYCVP|nr:hypothetical protein [Mycolicibacterium vanbaalenii]ABM16706.1 hypothetical protein Mvan_5947 [Mycolicibacterium vanbaalenii PYR-1]